MLLQKRGVRLKNTKKYDNTSISSLKGADRVRKRPAVIFGSDGIEGAQHSFFEILSNSIDEAREGFGNKIYIKRFRDLSISIEDFGRGIPLDYNQNEERYNWELIYTELYAGGKYNNSDMSNYEYSLGLNGLGACATQCASEYFDVVVKRDGYRYELHFEKGENVGGLKKTPLLQDEKASTGTYQKWKPDLDVFTDIEIELEYFKDVLKKQAVVNPNLTFYFEDEISGEKSEFHYENGIEDYVVELSESKEFTPVITFSGSGKGRDREDKPEYNFKMKMALCFNNENNVIEYYHNSSFLEYGGSPDKALKSAMVAVIDNEIRKQEKYNKNEKKITFQDVQDSLICVISSFSTITSYENQTKKAITNKFIQDFINDFIRKELEIYFIENAEITKRVIDQILINKRSRENAENTRMSIKKKLSQKVDLVNRVKKFVDCRSKNLQERELYIVEGDSALGACMQARNSEFQGLMAIRGKILNCLKADYEKIFANDIIVDLIKVLGCGIEIKSKHSKDLATFNLEDLRWSKVIICTDADVDGFQIRTLVLAMIYALMPTLIEEDKVFIAESPLYEINTKQDTYFAYNERERREILEKIGNAKYKIQRSKGLGENEPQMMWQTTMNPETRRLIRVKLEDKALTNEMFEILLGDELQGRKDFIRRYGDEYLELLDVM